MQEMQGWTFVAKSGPASFLSSPGCLDKRCLYPSSPSDNGPTKAEFQSRSIVISWHGTLNYLWHCSPSLKKIKKTLAFPILSWFTLLFQLACKRHFFRHTVLAIYVCNIMAHLPHTWYNRKMPFAELSTAHCLIILLSYENMDDKKCLGRQTGHLTDHSSCRRANKQWVV